MSEAVRIVRETTLGPIEVQHYLDGGLEAGLITALHGFALAHNVTMGQTVEKLFSWDPVKGYQVRRKTARLIIELGMRTGMRLRDPKIPEGDNR